MELNYNITKQDYVDLNLDYFNKNAMVQKSVTMLRIACVIIVLLGGTTLMFLLKSLTPVSVAMYALLAAVCFFLAPWFSKRKIVKNVDRILARSNNKQLCGKKTFILSDTGFELKGENEDTKYKYESVKRTSTDANHYFIFVDDYSALIIPFSAFKDDKQKEEFYSKITANITDEALKC